MAVAVARLNVRVFVEVEIVSPVFPDVAKIKDGPKTPLIVEVEPAPPVALIVTFPEEDEMVILVPAVIAPTPVKFTV